MQNFNMNSSLNQAKVATIQQQQQQQQHQQLLQHFHSQQQHHHLMSESSSAIDYSLNRQHPVGNAAAVNAFSQQQYQQKKLNYKSKLMSQHSESNDKYENISDDPNYSKTCNTNNKNRNDETDGDESNEPNQNLDSSLSNFSYATNEPSTFDPKSGKHGKKKTKSSSTQAAGSSKSQQHTLFQIKQEKEDDPSQLPANSKKRRESYLNENIHNGNNNNNTNMDDNFDDDHMSEMNDEDDDDDDCHTMNDSKEKRQKSDLNCVVCDSPANGYNFDAVTCESCKAFFRRNAFRPIVSWIFFFSFEINKFHIFFLSSTLFTLLIM